jgi:hypothetical protein
LLTGSIKTVYSSSIRLNQERAFIIFQESMNFKCGEITKGNL